MSQFHAISATSLCLASILVIISMFMSYRQELKLEKDIFISALRATIQLFVIGFILAYIFSTESPIFIIGLLGFMAINAASNSSKPANKRNTVVLPQPDGPRIVTNSPLLIVRLKSLIIVLEP